MLDIVATYHYIHFQGKLMNQTSEKGKKKKKTSFRAHFSLFWPKFGHQKKFCVFYLYLMLCIVASYQCMQFQGKLMQKKTRKLQKN